jgi:enoyl-CoA hydratase/carnithine racemase
MPVTRTVAAALCVELPPAHATLWLRSGALDSACCESAIPLIESLRERDDVRVVSLRGGKPGAPAPWPAPGVRPGSETLPLPRRLVAAVAALPMPVLAVLDGPVEGEALELALACDLRLASQGATFAMPQLQENRLPSCGGSQRLPRLVGLSAAWALFLGQRWDAERALALGLVSEVVPSAELDAEASRWAALLAERAPIAARMLKDTVRRGLDVPLEQGLLIEEDAYLLLQTTEDRKEGIRAFLQKRKPRFEGR